MLLKPKHKVKLCEMPLFECLKFLISGSVPFLLVIAFQAVSKHDSFNFLKIINDVFYGYCIIILFIRYIWLVLRVKMQD